MKTAIKYGLISGGLAFIMALPLTFLFSFTWVILVTLGTFLPNFLIRLILKP